MGAGEVVDGIIDIINYVPQPRTLPLEPAKINALLGTDISESDMIDYLRRLEIEVVDGQIQVPSFRPDLQQTADIAEEVARLYGYNEIPTTSFRSETAEGGYTGTMVLENKTGAVCRCLGYSEILTYSFVSPSIFDMIRLRAIDNRPYKAYFRLSMFQPAITAAKRETIAFTAEIWVSL